MLADEKKLGDSYKFVVKLNEGYVRHPETMECTDREVKAHDFKTLRRAKLYKAKLMKKGIAAEIEAIHWGCFW